MIVGSAGTCDAVASTVPRTACVHGSEQAKREEQLLEQRHARDAAAAARAQEEAAAAAAATADLQHQMEVGDAQSAATNGAAHMHGGPAVRCMTVKYT